MRTCTVKGLCTDFTCQSPFTTKVSIRLCMKTVACPFFGNDGRATVMKGRERERDDMQQMSPARIKARMLQLYAS